MARPFLGGSSAGVKDLTAASTLSVADSGKVLFLNSSAEFATTLPAPSKGLKFSFVVKAAPSGASYTIVTPSGAILGSCAQGNAVPDMSDGSDTIITFVDGSAVVGDRIDLICDGTNYYIVGGLAKVGAGMTIR